MLKKTRILIIALLLVCAAVCGALIAGCDGETEKPDGPKTVAVEGVTMNKSSLTLEVGGAETLTATVSPDNATDKAVSWTSSAEGVATVENGKVTAVSEGKAIITAAAGGKSAICTVTVKNKYIFVESISLNKSELTLEAGAEETLSVIFNPANATDKSVKWTSQDKNVATVEGGKVTAVAEGSALIIAEVSQLRVGCTVTVVPATVKAESVTLNKTELELEIGEEEALAATVLPADASDKTVTWSSSDNSIATVDANGKLTAKAVGDATITAKTANNKTATCTVTVNPLTIAVENITLNKTELTLEAGDEETLTATVLPGDAANKTLIWTSSAESVATVEDGKVTAVSKGTATITVKTANNKTATCEVTVTGIEAGSIALDKTEFTINYGGETDLTITRLPLGVKVTEVEWSTDKPEILTVSQDGHIEAISGGTATVTASAGGQSASCAVTVKGFAFRYVSSLNAYAIAKGSVLDDDQTEIEIPEKAKDRKFVLWIDDEAFARNSTITKVKIPSMVSIGVKAFFQCTKLEEVVIGSGNEGVSEIKESAFQQCYKLARINLDYYGLEVIGKNAFRSTALVGYTTDRVMQLSSSLVELGDYAFCGCNFKRITLPRSLEKIGEGVFSGCTRLYEVNFACTITSIGKYFFRDCGNLKYIGVWLSYDEWLALPKGTDWAKNVGIYVNDGYGCLIQTNDGQSHSIDESLNR